MRSMLSAQLAAHQTAPSDIRWTNPNQFHVTLKFLGDVGPEELISLCDIVRNAAEQIQPFSLSLSEIGAFPTQRRPRVLWCGVHDESAGCARWVAYAEPRFEELGFEFEERPFHAHVTLARASTEAGSRQLARLVPELRLPSTPPLQVERIILFESHLQPEGAVHKPLFTVALSGKSDLQPEPV